MRKNADILAITLITASVLLGQATAERLMSPAMVFFLASGQPDLACPIQSALRSASEDLPSRLEPSARACLRKLLSLAASSLYPQT